MLFSVLKHRQHQLALLHRAYAVRCAIYARDQHTAFSHTRLFECHGGTDGHFVIVGDHRVKLTALVISGLYAGGAGAAWALLFGYAGASFATIQYSILPMLYALMGGAGTVIGPFLGALVMFALIETASGLTSAYLFLVGLALVILVLFAPKGILGTIRERWVKWLP